MLRSLYKSIFSPFTKLEQKLLEILLSGFDGEARRLLEAQLRDVNKVGRERQGKEVILYRLRWFHVYRDPRLSFPVGEEVVRFARVSFSSVSTGRLTADFFITRGFFSIMEFSKTPPKIRAAEEIEHAALKVLRNPLEISANPMPRTVISIEKAGGELRTLLSDCGAHRVFGPLAKSELDAELRDSGFVLPGDLQKLLSRVDGFETEEWEFHGVKDLRLISHESDEFVIVAENSQGGGMGFRKSSPDDGYFLLTFESDEPMFLAKDYNGAARHLVGQKGLIE